MKTNQPDNKWGISPTLAEASDLLVEAIARLHEPKHVTEAACWRVADALLLLSLEFPEAQGIGHPTGRGGQLKHTAEALKSGSAGSLTGSVANRHFSSSQIVQDEGGAS